MLTRFNRKTAAVLSGVTASLIVAIPASASQETPVVVLAEPQEHVRIEHVSYADLDLATLPGEKRLRYRVANAVKRVCDFNTGRVGLQDLGYYSCAEGAWEGANPQIAQAVQRSRDIAQTGSSSIAAVAITLNIPSR